MFIHDMEQDGILEQAYELGLGEKLGLAYELGHEKRACELELDGTLGLAYELERDVLELGDMELACVRELELHSLHKKHLRCNHYSDQRYILHAGLCHRVDARCTLH